MKKIIVSIIICTASTVAMSQEKENNPERIKLYPSSHNTRTVELTADEEIKKCNHQLDALDKKEEWLKSHPEELQVAKETGWFEMAEKQRVELKARIKELKK